MYIYISPFYHFFRAIFLIFTIVSGVGQSNMDGSIQPYLFHVARPSRRLQPWIRLRYNPRGNFRSNYQRSDYRKPRSWRLRQRLVQIVLQHRLPLAHVICPPACQAPHWHLRFQRSLQMRTCLFYLGSSQFSCLCKLLFLDLSIKWHVFTSDGGVLGCRWFSSVRERCCGVRRALQTQSFDAGRIAIARLMPGCVAIYRLYTDAEQS